MNNLYITQCVHCGRRIESTDPCIGEKVICVQCSVKGILRRQLNEEYVDLRTEEILDKALKQAIKEDDPRKWYQRMRDYIKKIIN